jgi:23S rRNA (cytidine1920-2'-O)/16S rRNA (cytidine1409-2'-O)-methyltransferase
LLIKPQFETKGQSLRNGIVTNQQAIEDVIKHLNEALIELRYDLKGIIPSRTKGKTGNQEYMVWVQKDATRVVD